MRIRALCILEQMLDLFHDFLESSEIEVRKIWRHYFTEEELFEIVEIKLDKEHTSLFRNKGLNMDDILVLIGEEEWIVKYILQKLSNTIQRSSIPTDKESIHELLNQLGMETHYLIQKAGQELDSYDLSNLKSLYRKAGWLKDVYGIYDKGVSEEDIQSVTTHPDVYYDSISEAKEFMNQQTKVDSEYEANYHILPRDWFVHPKNL